MQYHSQQLTAIESHLKTQISGLAHAEAHQRIEQYGKNVLQVTKRKTWLSMFLSQFTDFMIVVLIVAAVISGFIGEAKDTIVILSIVIINAIIGFIQEWRAEKSMEALEKMAASRARVPPKGNDVRSPIGGRVRVVGRAAARTGRSR